MIHLDEMRHLVGHDVIQQARRRMDEANEVMAYGRVHNDEEIVIAINVADEERTVPLPIRKRAKAIFGNPSINGDQVTIPARSGVVIK